MNAIPNVLVDIQRGTTPNVFGDDTDSATTVHTGVPFSILENRRANTRRADARAQTVLYFTGRCNGGTDVLMDDRLRTADGTYYLVTDVSTPGSVGQANDVRCDLTRVKSN